MAILAVPVSIFASRLGGFVAASPLPSWGVLGSGETEADALSAAEAEIIRRRSAGAASLAAVRASGCREAAFAEARRALGY